MKKRTLSLLLALLLLASLMPSAALAEKSETDVAYAVTGGNIYFDKTTGTITACDGNVTEAVIPEAIEGVSVTSIGNRAFSDHSSLTSVTIPDSVTSIDAYAFSCCTGLTSVTIPNSVTSIGDYAFSGCTGLTNITIPDSVTSIGDLAFRGCTGLTSVTLPDSVTSINGAFLDCTGLTSVTIPNSVTSIGGSAFSGCTGLTNITIPNSVTSIGFFAFRGCTGLTSVTIPNSVTSIGIAAFRGCMGLTSVTIPDSVTIINGYAFDGCTGLTSVTIPNSVTRIYGSAFRGCTSLTSADIQSLFILENAFEGCTSLKSVDIKASEGIENYAFKNCPNIETVNIKSCPEIEEYAFQGCAKLKSLTLPDDLKTIGTFAFQGCTGLETLKIPSVETIDASAFSGCSALTSVSLPKNVKTIGNAAFRYCDNIKDVYYAGSETEWSAITIQPYNEALTGATIHYGEETHTHDYTAVVTAPTCTEKGYTTYTCACGDSYVDNYTNSLGHTYKDGVCTRCGAKDPNAHTHIYAEAVTKPSCTEKGYTTYSCTICGDSYKGSYTNALGHHYANGKCTRCGAADPDYKPVMNFVDVPSTSYCYDAVQWAVANGITNGTDATHFSPNAGCTRAQVVTFLWRAAGSPDVSAKVNFVDVSASSVYYKAIMWAVANGITKGTDATHFSPNATCTRGQVVTFMYRAAGESAVSGSGSFSDVASGSYCYNAVQWAVANGITKGTDATHFSPNATCTRGQVVTFLYRAQ